MADIKSNYEFQGIIAKFVEKMGFQIDQARMLDDGSVDFKAKTTNPMGGRIYSLIRASAYNRMVNANDILNLHDSMKSLGAIRAAYITTSGFSEDAIEAARDKPISLINKYQLMDSIEKRGLLSDTELMESLDKLGMGEQHFQGYEQSFKSAKSDAELNAQFQSKAKSKEKLGQVESRYAPLTVLKVITMKDVSTDDQTLRSVEKKDYMFVNLNNLDLYYIMQKRKRNTTKNLLMRSDIIKRIHVLPDESREYLLHLLAYGDLPIEDIKGKDLSILNNKEFIEIYEGKRYKNDLIGYTKIITSSLTELLSILTREIASGISTFGEGTATEDKPEPLKKKVAAQVEMPHKAGGVYDIWKFLETTRGLEYGAEIDSLSYSSSDVGNILGAVMKGKVKSEGIIFMPYFRVKYVDSSGKVVRYEMLITPKFKGVEPKKTDVKGVPKIKSGVMVPRSKFKVIR